MEDFNKRLLQVLANLNISKTDLAVQLGVTKQVLNKWFNHGVIPDGKSLFLFKAKFNISIDWLLTGSGSIYGGEPDKNKDEMIDSLKATLLEKENQLRRVREVVQLSESRTEAINNTSKTLAVNIAKRDPAPLLKKKK